MPNTPTEPEKTEQSIFTAWEQWHQKPVCEQPEGMWRLTEKREWALHQEPGDSVIQILLHYSEHYSLLTEMPRFFPWLAHMGLIMVSENSSQGRITDTRKKSIFLLCPGLTKNESLRERQIG